MMKPLLVSLVLLVLPSLACATDFFLEGGLGLTQFHRTQEDGVWIQERLPHQWEWQDVAFRGGGGIKVNESWSVGVNYVRLGTVKLANVWQSDETYDSQCGLKCGGDSGHAWGTYQGGELIGTYHPQWGAVSPILRAGLAVFDHTIRWQFDGNEAVHQYRGVVVSGVLGAGACYHGWACVDLSYYRGFADTYYPLSTGAVVSMLTLRYGF